VPLDLCSTGDGLEERSRGVITDPSSFSEK